MKKLIGLIMLGVMVMGAMPAGAQEGAAACDVAEIVKAQGETLAEAATVEDLVAVQAALNSAIAGCMGLAFEDEGATAIGPVEIPGGLYKVTFTTGGDGQVAVTVVDGTCEAPNSVYGTTIFYIEEGQAANGAEIFFKSEGCTALIEISELFAPSDPWTLEFAAMQ